MNSDPVIFAEESIVGCVALNPQLMATLRSIRPHDFVDQQLADCWRSIESACNAGAQDSTAIFNHLAANHSADHARRVVEIAHELPNWSSARYYGDEVKRFAKLRQLRTLAHVVLTKIEDNTENPDDLVDNLSHRLDSIRDPKAQSAPSFEPISFNEFSQLYTQMRPEVVRGLLRRGETMNVIGASKTGKSFLVGGLAWSVATGRTWLGHEVVPGRVLIIDNELHPETLQTRLDAIAFHSQIEYSERSNLDLISVRGQGVTINDLKNWFRIKPKQYDLVILDALYRFIPQGTSENDNSSMMQVYNKLDGLAKEWDCSIVVVHHSSKGNQSDKSVTDVGAGAGAISRACDTHLVIRPHEQDELAVLEAVTRSFKSPEPISIRYEYPLWQAVACEPEVKKLSGRTKDDPVQMDKEADQQLGELLNGHWLSEAQIVRKTGMGPTRVSRAVGRAVATGLVASKRVKRQGRRVTVYGSTATPTATAGNGVASP